MAAGFVYNDENNPVALLLNRISQLEGGLRGGTMVSFSPPVIATGMENFSGKNNGLRFRYSALVHAWHRDFHNPNLPPGGGVFGVGCCINPFVLRR